MTVEQHPYFSSVSGLNKLKMASKSISNLGNGELSIKMSQDYKYYVAYPETFVRKTTDKGDTLEAVEEIRDTPEQAIMAYYLRLCLEKVFVSRKNGTELGVFTWNYDTRSFASVGTKNE